jgi:chemotaxis protein MotB
MEDEARSSAPRRRRWLPWGLLAGTVLAAGTGGWLASRSISALLARTAQLEREAAESEARVAELQVLRASMERRLRTLERPPSGPEARSDIRPASLPALAREADAQLAGREAARKTLESRLKQELRTGDAFLDESHGRLRVELTERLLFAPGQPTLTPRGAEVLARVGAVLAPLTDHTVQVAAHTDEIPGPGALAGTASPATSWELSAARAVAVVRHLVDAARLPPERLAATGQASYRPVVPHHHPRARVRNRRVELLLAPTPAEPVSARAAPPPRAAPRLAHER